MEDFPAVSGCPNCGSSNIMTIDIAMPPMMYECAACNRRFHRLGFAPHEVEVNVSIAAPERLVLDSLLKR